MKNKISAGRYLRVHKMDFGEHVLSTGKALEDFKLHGYACSHLHFVQIYAADVWRINWARMDAKSSPGAYSGHSSKR
jgi:hypothetical protein